MAHSTGRRPRPSGPGGHLRGRLRQVPAGAAYHTSEGGHGWSANAEKARRTGEEPLEAEQDQAGGAQWNSRRATSVGIQSPRECKGKDRAIGHSLASPPAGREGPSLLAVGCAFSYSPSWLSMDSHLSGADSEQQVPPPGAQNGNRAWDSVFGAPGSRIMPFRRQLAPLILVPGAPLVDETSLTAACGTAWF